MSAESFAVSITTVEHFPWGKGCDGWRLLSQPDLSVIQERVPAGAGEVPHFHHLARQFFYILKGTGIVKFAENPVRVEAGQGIHAPPGVAHQFANPTAEAVEFLVISAPSTSGDRVNLDA